MPWYKRVLFLIPPILLLAALPAIAEETDLLPALETLLPAAAENEASGTDLAGIELPEPEPLPEAEDLTAECLINGYHISQHLDKMRDNKYSTYWESTPINGVHSVEIVPPEGKPVYGITVKWRSDPVKAAVQCLDADGNWQTVGTTAGHFNEEYLALPGIGTFRIVNAASERKKLLICEIRIIGKGSLPSFVHIWEKPVQNMDLMLIAGHPDDEILWFGGLLPYYAGERGKKVLVVTAAYNIFYRKLELLDCLWTCGIHYYPHFLGYTDMVTSNVNYVINQWGGNRCYRDVTQLLRRYRPKVLVLQDINGEYGHGIHKAVTRLGMAAVGYADDPSRYMNEKVTYATYNVPKVYIHLWKENQITMNWHVPLAHFGGRTAQDVAREAYKCHTSQQHKSYYSVKDGGEFNNALFGLWHTTVGPDVAGNDLFEHLED